MSRIALQFLPVVALASVIVGTIAPPARACACCSFVGQRTDVVRELDDPIAAQLALMNFRRQAKLAVGERYEDAIPGIEDPAMDYTVTVTRLADRMTFGFRDAKGRTGTLSLANPKTIAIFEVDPRDGPDRGTGPSLYKEWRMSGPLAGDGIFGASAEPDRNITLVLHGRGNSCTDAHDFTHWTLTAHGSGFMGFSLYGDLTTDQVK
jgi:hypothetical protein